VFKFEDWWLTGMPEMRVEHLLFGEKLALSLFSKCSWYKR
jgi:hypothetical protein